MSSVSKNRGRAVVNQIYATSVFAGRTRRFLNRSGWVRGGAVVGGGPVFFNLTALNAAVRNVGKSLPKKKTNRPFRARAPN